MRFCSICDTFLVQRPGESPYKFRGRKTCSDRCKFQQIVKTRTSPVPELCEFEAELTPLRPWPKMQFTDVKTMDYGRLVARPEAWVPQGSTMDDWLKSPFAEG